MTKADYGEYRSKLIDVTLPLIHIGAASVAEKQRSVGTVKNLHKWFAPMPTPALRALVFASLVDDPGPGDERDYLLQVVKDLLPLDGTAPSKAAIGQARELIAKSNSEIPVVMDPFVGGGATIVEALRLGLPARGSDLNPVAALITRMLGQLLPSVVAASPISEEGNRPTRTEDLPYEGFADDLRYYGGLVQQAVKEQVGHYYDVPDKGAPVAWLWARTAPCPNPMCNIRIPLYSSPWLSKQKDREATLEPVVEDDKIRFVIHRGKDGPIKGTKGTGRAQFNCPKCGSRLGEKELRALGKEGRLGLQLMAYCVDTPAGRTFLEPDPDNSTAQVVEVPDDLDETEIGGNTKNFAPPLYGFIRQIDLYTSRQLAVLAAFADEIAKIYDRVAEDGGTTDQASAISTALGICLSKMSQSNSTLVRWYIREGPSRCMPAFGSQSIPMVWDFAEAYPFGHSVGSWNTQIDTVIGLLRALPGAQVKGDIYQCDARRAGELVEPGTALIVTDPPYFAQINYADLSDYFYLWLRRALRDVHPDLFGTIATPKVPELVANIARHGGSKDAAQKYFIEGFIEVFKSLQKASRPDLPIIVAYAAKQDDSGGDGAVSSAWVSMLQAILASGLSVVGTLPIECTHKTRQISQGANALASYIILICRTRNSVEVADKATFLDHLKNEMPSGIDALLKAGVSPLDMGQAAIGPGMRIFSSYREVLQPDGSPMSVRDALIEIDKAATAIIDGEEAEYDAPTRFALKWFRQYAFDQGPYGVADGVLRQTGTAILDLVQAGIVSNSPRSKVSLLDFDELPVKYDPVKPHRISHWEVAMHLAKRFDMKGPGGGIDGAAELVAAVRSRPDAAINLDRVNRLVHRLFRISEHRYQKTAARLNQLGTAWPDIMAAAQNVSSVRYVSDEIDGLFSVGEADDEG
ncbi:DUF1156 domain-containing protein [Actinomadura sp. KC06]|uniref:DUF1156 domain-containing protein n=1 Tax=Actinomadura sp. KC06 TaxID=2530369 RepID=UPI00104ECA5A|nr:DUF1156 domain-containing protein [Actinomadura sp. KC06]TDD36826.1 DUF1156 domain-containing protein [Actinomadura sp. KC06]